jgi:thymidylate synthase
MENQKSAVWHAFVITVFIFLIGVSLGIVLENLRTEKISDLYQQSELDLLDIKLQSEIYSLEKFNCKNAVEENIIFADRIFKEAKKLERYESAARLTDNIKIQHKKYDLLRTDLFLNSLKIKQKCGDGYNEIVYFYQYINPSIETKAKQEIVSKVLEELKNKKGDEMLLIPISGDNDISAVKLLMKEYNIEKLPTILINRKTKITDIKNADEIYKYFK